MYKAFIVEDDKIEQLFVKTELKRHEGFGEPVVFDMPEAFLSFKAKTADKPDVIILDLNFEGSEIGGLDLVRKTRKRYPEIAIVCRSNQYDLAGKVIPSGANDFIAKNSFEGEICLRLENAILNSKRNIDHVSLPREDVVGETLVTIANRAEKILASAIRSIHIYGESGTGKEVVAKMFDTKKQPFVVVNCGAISENLYEAELFGSVKGAYTGSVKDTVGYIEQADGGTIYLDEIALLPLHCQSALLRVIENNEYRRLGDPKIRNAHVRIITATNEDLALLCEEGRFRKDFYQRLKEAEIHIPPLRDRMDELEALIRYFCESMAGGPYQITDSALSVLMQYDWREGNVRELRNCLRAMSEKHVNKLLSPISIPPAFFEKIDDHDQDEESIDTKGSELLEGNEVLQIKLGKSVNYQFLCDLLLYELTKILTQRSKNFSLRRTSNQIGIGRAKFSKILHRLVDRGVLTAEELDGILGQGG
jgi:DNA-binding NtrC family response regulator